MISVENSYAASYFSQNHCEKKFWEQFSKNQDSLNKSINL